MSAPRTPPAFIPTLKPLQEGEAAAMKAAPLLIDLPLLEEEVLPPEAQLGHIPAAFRAMPNIDLNLGDVGAGSLNRTAAVRPAPVAAQNVAAQPVTPPSEARPAAVRGSVSTGQSSVQSAIQRQGIDDSAQQAEQMRTRLLQRVDVIVQRRVREAATAIALEHAQNLLQELRPALEKAIIESVNEALALEVATRSKASL